MFHVTWHVEPHLPTRGQEHNVGTANKAKMKAIAKGIIDMRCQDGLIWIDLRTGRIANPIFSNSLVVGDGEYDV